MRRWSRPRRAGRRATRARERRPTAQRAMEWNGVARRRCAAKAGSAGGSSPRPGVAAHRFRAARLHRGASAQAGPRQLTQAPAMVPERLCDARCSQGPWDDGARQSLTLQSGQRRVDERRGPTSSVVVDIPARVGSAKRGLRAPHAAKGACSSGSARVKTGRPALKPNMGWAISATAMPGSLASITTRSAGAPGARP